MRRGYILSLTAALLLCSAGCTLKEDCLNCNLEIKVPNLPDCIEYHPDSDTLTTCPDAGTDESKD